MKNVSSASQKAAGRFNQDSEMFTNCSLDTQGAEEVTYHDEPSPVMGWLVGAWLGFLPVLALIVAWQQEWI